MTIDRQLDAYRRGELTLVELVAELPPVSDASPDLIELVDALEAGRVPPEVITAWSHPGSAHHHATAETHRDRHAHIEPRPPHGREARGSRDRLPPIRASIGLRPDRARRFGPGPLVD